MAVAVAFGGMTAFGSGAAEPAGKPAARVVAPEAEACKGCHEKYVETYAKTKHGQSGNSKGPDC